VTSTFSSEDLEVLRNRTFRWSPGGSTTSTQLDREIARLSLLCQARAASVNDIAPEVAWWDTYGDPVLSDLVPRAARENRDPKIAAERVRAARAGELISRSWLFSSIK